MGGLARNGGLLELLVMLTDGMTEKRRKGERKKRRRRRRRRRSRGGVREGSGRRSKEK